MDNKKYVDYILEQAENLINIDSPSGYGEGVTQYLLDEFGKMGYHAYRTGKGASSQTWAGRMRMTPSYWRGTAIPWEPWSMRSRQTAI